MSEKLTKRLLAIFIGVAILTTVMSVASFLFAKSYRTPENKTPLSSECKLVVFSEDCFYPYSETNVSISEQITKFLSSNPGWYVKDIDCVYYPRNASLGSISVYVTFQKDY